MLDSSINKRILEIISQSSCFGIAYSGDAEECEKCSVAYQCEIKSASDVGESIEMQISKAKKESKANKAPNAKKSTTPSTSSKKKSATATPKSESAKIEGDMPNFKEMSYEDLVELANKNNVPIQDYKSPQINRMRLIMSLKKLYQ